MTKNPEIYCILGMHRSGTSLATRALNLLGLYLGSEESTGEVGNDNIKGYWEHIGIRDLNDQILTRLGGSWHEPPTFAPGWESDHAITDLLEPARALIDEGFSGVKRWGWKDPRNCLTLPFWQRLLPDVRYIISMRNPIDVARSLEYRDGFCVEKGINLWLTYTNCALQHTSGRRRLLVFYEDFVTDWLTELQRAADFIGESERAGHGEVQSAVEEFIEEGLHHHRSSVVDAAADSRFTFPAKALYMAQRMYVSLNRKDAGNRANRDSQLEESLNIFSRYSVEARDDLVSLREQLINQEQTLAERESTVSDLREQIMRQSELLAEGENSMNGLQEQLSKQEEALAMRENDLQALQKKMEGMTNTMGWRLLSYYGRIKYRYLLPIYRLLGAIPSDAAEVARVRDGAKQGTSSDP